MVGGRVRYGRVWYGTVRCEMVRCGTFLCGRVRCGAVWCGAEFCGPWFWVLLVKYSSFGWLCLLITDNLTDHDCVFLFVELIFILFRQGLCQQVL